MAKKPRKPDAHADLLDAGRMSIGEHLEELRLRVIYSLVALGAGAGICLYFGRTILQFVCQPAVAMLELNHLPTRLQTLSVQEPFFIWLKMGVLGGLMAATPVVVWQIWKFVSVGLYAHEQRFLRLTVPASLLLFAGGVLFFHFIVLPIVLNFFITFGQEFQLGNPRPDWLQQKLVGRPEETTTQPAAKLPPLTTYPVLDGNPRNPPDGAIWIDRDTHQIRIAVGGEVRTIQTMPTGRQSILDSQFRLGEYISFVLSLYLAFGLAFQLPIVIVFLTTLGIVKVEVLARSRKYVIFGIFVAAAILTPPDVVSQICLALPMMLLFEAGLFVSKLLKREPAATS